ncbi:MULTISPECIES: hypothetical protein [Roseomonadaceae]|uniref:Secreted protein n=1 Tax=Falsiroseomonas oleicola TaxID=2801474 RepID=A0ABS6H7Y7_9PROT|nr:hypothetical protein [Roseomonas oleicola]MBU8544818.1 hypothetical protein [Roseomonas oleicola]
MATVFMLVILSVGEVVVVVMPASAAGMRVGSPTSRPAPPASSARLSGHRPRTFGSAHPREGAIRCVETDRTRIISSTDDALSMPTPLRVGYKISVLDFI